MPHFGIKENKIQSGKVILALDSNHDDLLLRSSQFIITSEILYKGQKQSPLMSMSFVSKFKCSVLLLISMCQINLISALRAKLTCRIFLKNSLESLNEGLSVSKLQWLSIPFGFTHYF